MGQLRNSQRYMIGLIVALVASAAAGPSFGQAPNTWTAIGGSGYVDSLAIDPANPNVIYVGTYYGVFKTTDGGASWIGSGLPPTHAIAVDPVNPNNVYAGTHPGGTCRDTYPLFKSIDAGATWSNATSPGACDVSIIVLDPRAPTSIYVESTSRWSINAEPVELWKTMDSGISWVRRVTPGGPGLVISPSNAQVIYAPSDRNDIMPVASLWKSTDGGASWDSTVPISNNSRVFSLAIDPINLNVIYAGVSDDATGLNRLVKSVDGGASWFASDNGLGDFRISAMVVDRDNPRTLYIATYGSGVFKSIDGGAHWSALNDGLTNRDISTLVLAAGNPRVLFAGTYGSGVFKLESEPTTTNAIDDAQFFIRQHYRDFLNREPDDGGLAFWTNEIISCGGDAQCIEAKRINVSAAYFLSIEFQQTGYLVYRFYKAAYGNAPGAPVPVRLSDFLPDTQQIRQGVVVNQAGWEQVLEGNKQAFATEFVQRSRFVSAYPTSMSSQQFVNALFANAGVTPAASDRSAVINEFAFAATTADVAARARALRRVAENSTLAQQEFNRAFVLTQYFGYLRRNPNDPPETTLDFQGYNFWLNKLNQFNGDYIAAEMVKSFIVSSEYKHRFGP